jgi:hypothetical protein
MAAKPLATKITQNKCQQGQRNQCLCRFAAGSAAASVSSGLRTSPAASAAPAACTAVAFWCCRCTPGGVAAAAAAADEVELLGAAACPAPAALRGDTLKNDVMADCFLRMSTAVSGWLYLRQRV